MQPGGFHVPGSQNATQARWPNMQTHAEDLESGIGFGNASLRRVNLGELSHQMTGMQTQQRSVRQNCGTNLPLHHNLISGSRDQIGSRFSVSNGEAEESMSYAPRTMPSDSLGKSYKKPLHKSRSERMNPTSHEPSHRPSHFTERHSYYFDPPPYLTDDPCHFPEHRSHFRPGPSYIAAVTQLSIAEHLQRLQAGSNRSYSGDLNGPQDVYQTPLIRSSRGAPDAYMSMSRGLPEALRANENTMSSDRRPHEFSHFDQGDIASAAAPWPPGNSGQNNIDHSQVPIGLNAGFLMGLQERNFPNGALQNTLEPSSRGFHAFGVREPALYPVPSSRGFPAFGVREPTLYPYPAPSSRGFPAFGVREPTLYPYPAPSSRDFSAFNSREPSSQRLHPTSMHSGHLSSRTPAQPVSYSGLNAQGGLFAYRAPSHAAATGGTIPGSQRAPGNAYPPFESLNRSAMSPTFQGNYESIGSPMQNSYAPRRDFDEEMSPSPSQWYDAEMVEDARSEFEDRYLGVELDVDNMSYEELLALENRIGNVNMGLSEENMRRCLREYVTECVSQEGEIKCCICQEEYTEGDALGQLNCSHSYHSRCIKQWLGLKNQCPLCKACAF